MKKFIVETYYTCTFKTVHKLDELNDTELSKIDSRNDEVEVIDVRLNKRNTKKIGEKIKNKEIKKSEKLDDFKEIIANKASNQTFENKTNPFKMSKKLNSGRFRMPDRRKVTFKKLLLEITKFISIQGNIMMEKLGKFLLIQIKRVN